MTDDASVYTFNCPSCGAPIEPLPGADMMKCKFCGSTVSIPKASRRRTRTSSSAPASAPIGSGCTKWIVVIAVIAIFLVAGLAAGAYVIGSIVASNPAVGNASSALSSVTGSGIAKPVLTFGSRGIGRGMFTDARVVAIDPHGNIIVGDEQDGRVQTFDPSGKFISQFSLGPKVTVRALAVSPDGKLYVAHEGKVSVYDSSGEEVNTLEAAHSADALTFGSDGKLYALTTDDAVERLDAKGEIDLTIPSAFESVLGDSESTQYIAVDGLGNIYIVGDYNCVVLKYSPSGKFLDQFGGKAESHGPAVLGTLFTPSGIVVDGYGRIFVSDVNTDVEVFDANDKPLKSIDSLTLGFTANVYGMTIDGQNNIYLALGDKIQKLQVQKPTGQ